MAKVQYMRRATIPRPIITGNSIVVELPYVNVYQLTTALTGEVTALWRGASIFDPEFTFGGHQPLGHDQWATFYGRYKVLNCRIEAEVTNRLTSTTEPAMFVLAAQQSSTVSTVTDLAEQPYAKQTLIQSGETHAKKLTMSMDTKYFEGYPTDDIDFTASFGADPVRDWYYVIGLKNANGGNNVNCNVIVKLIYKVRLFSRLELLRS